MQRNKDESQGRPDLERDHDLEPSTLPPSDTRSGERGPARSCSRQPAPGRTRSGHADFRSVDSERARTAATKV